ncbi:MAG: hypothetical protein H7257_11390 [Taibaiella sp.]|nr:hypothetical protein [Taibaiella sp.]
MKSNLTYAAGILVAVTLLAACGKNYSNEPGADPSKLNSLFAELRPAPQILIVTAGTAAQVTGTGGTALNFYPNSFKDANGHIITSGTVTLQLTEMYSTGDMIANRASTTAAGKILQSGGQINLNASINGQKVFANVYGVQFRQQSASAAPMNIFYGANNNIDSVVTWKNGGDTSRAGSVAWGTTYYGGYDQYIFDSCTQFGWTNCDQFYNTDSPMTSVSVILPGKTHTPSNTQIYLVLPDTKSVMSNAEPGLGGEAYNATTNKMTLVSEGQIKIVPTGMNYKFVAISKINGTYYYFQQAGVTSLDMKFKATMATKTKAEVTALLKAL